MWVRGVGERLAMGREGCNTCDVSVERKSKVGSKEQDSGRVEEYVRGRPRRILITGESSYGGAKVSSLNEGPGGYISDEEQKVKAFYTSTKKPKIQNGSMQEEGKEEGGVSVG